MENDSNKSMNSYLLLVAFSRTEGVIWCTAFAKVSFFIIEGNFLVLVVFALNTEKLRKKSFLLDINMAFADLILRALSLPVFIYELGGSFGLKYRSPLNMKSTCERFFNRKKTGEKLKKRRQSPGLQ